MNSHSGDNWSGEQPIDSSKYLKNSEGYNPPEENPTRDGLPFIQFNEFYEFGFRIRAKGDYEVILIKNSSALPGFIALAQWLALGCVL